MAMMSGIGSMAMIRGVPMIKEHFEDCILHHDDIFELIAEYYKKGWTLYSFDVSDEPEIGVARFRRVEANND